MPAAASGVPAPLGEGKSPGPLDPGVDRRLLRARQIRLYIENTPDYLRFGVPLIAVGIAILWPFVPDQRVTYACWGTVIFLTILVRLVAWIAYLQATPGDAAIDTWLKWFFAPQLCAVGLISAGPLVFLPSSSGHDMELTLLFAGYAAALAFTVVLLTASYRPLIAPITAVLALIPTVGLVRSPAAMALPIALACPAIAFFAYRLGRKLNQAFVHSMELSVRNERLVAALETRTAELQRQTLAAERAERDKTRFLAAASHDLRQPMHAISLLVGMLRPRAESAEQRAVVERLERSVETMDRLFGTILDLSKLDAGAVHPSVAPVPLHPVFESIEMHFAPQAAAKRLALRVFPSRAVVSTDRVLLDRVLRNLVSNAIKYTSEGRVLVGCRRRGGRLLVGVWDTGVGIAAEDRDRIFEEYFQAGGGVRDRGEGLGLGLAIVRRLARLLGAEIEVVSIPGRGSRFGLEIPLVRYLGEETRQDDESERVTELLGKFVLVVEDEPDVRFAALALLQRWGCRAAAAASIGEVAALLEREVRFPDAIVTDYRLGEGQTGLNVIATVRQYTGERTPAVVVTGEELGTAELEVGGSTYAVVKKPLTAEQLRRLLVAAVSRQAEEEPRK
jgi:signal transduction histidine kinase/CheY-like chemotaxis protein